MLNKVYTHKGVFHADEVSAIALLKVFYNDKIDVERVPHQQDFTGIRNGEVFIIDIGGLYEPETYSFDHHQFRPEDQVLSSAGMILLWLRTAGFIPTELYQILRKDYISDIDLNDIGLKKSEPNELSSIVSCYNLDKPNSYEQDNAFEDAVSMVMRVFSSVKRRYESDVKAKEKILSLKHSDGIMYSEEFVPGWNKALAGNNIGVEIFAWFDNETGEYKAQNVPLEVGSFDAIGRKIMYNKSDVKDDVVFVHKGNFFIVTKTKEALLKYLENNLK